METCKINGVELGIERFGAETSPPVLCLGAPTMLSWPDALCTALADRGRCVVRCDLRDAGVSTRGDLDAPDYTLRDLAADAAALAGTLGEGSVHLAGIGISGMVAQVAAVDHPGAFSALTVIGSRPVAPGPVDADLPDHDPAAMGRLFSRGQPDWTDRSEVAEFAAEAATILGDDPVEARERAARIWERTNSSDPADHLADQSAMVFSRLDCRPRWRERLPELTLPTLIVHGRLDPFFPVGNGEALARDIPDARLLVLDDAAREIPRPDIPEVAAAMAGL